MTDSAINISTDNICRIAKKAGDAILDVYNSDDFEIETKDNDSPLTKADKRASSIIEEELKKISDSPIIF